MSLVSVRTSVRLAFTIGSFPVFGFDTLQDIGLHGFELALEFSLGGWPLSCIRGDSLRNCALTVANYLRLVGHIGRELRICSPWVDEASRAFYRSAANGLGSRLFPDPVGLGIGPFGIQLE